MYWNAKGVAFRKIQQMHLTEMVFYFEIRMSLLFDNMFKDVSESSYTEKKRNNTRATNFSKL